MSAIEHPVIDLTTVAPERAELPQVDRKDFSSDQEVRWCPGCGDYAILAAVQATLPDIGCRPESTVFVSGIGCAARFPYYMDTYGMHSIHGRAPAIASGLAVARPDLDVFVVGGDGDMLSIGGNHLVHALRRNVDLTILLFNNEIYGLTKGQYSPTSPIGSAFKSTPVGSIDRPLNPLSLAIGSEATFVARTIDNDRKHLAGVLAAAHAHRGAALVEILQNCVVFNDGAFAIRDRDAARARRLDLVAGEPLVFGAEGERAVVRTDGGGLAVVPTAEAGDEVVVHDPTRSDPTTAFALSRLEHQPDGPTPLGILRQVQRPAYETEARRQVEDAKARRPADLGALLASGSTWTVD